MKKKHLFFITLVLQIVFLSSMVVFHQMKIISARKVILKTIPYDPLSAFRGYYMDLNYEISTLNTSLLKNCKKEDLKANNEVFVLLQKDTNLGYWQAKGIYRIRPKKNHPNEVYLKGRLPNYFKIHIASENTKNTEIRIEYGIESFFLNENRIDEVEKINRPNTWQERQNKKKELIAKLDEETQRINKNSISKWWVEKLNGELEIWLNQSLIDLKIHDSIYNKYKQTMETLDKIDTTVNTLSDADSTSTQEPLTVEIAIDKQGNGYPIKLIHANKTYK